MNITKLLKDNAWWMIIVLIVFSGVTCAVYLIHVDEMNDEEIVVEGSIVKVNYLGSPPKGSGYFSDCDLLEIIFDDNSSYIIVTRKDLDLVVHSKFIIRFYKDEPDDYWTIDRIHKVPD